MARFPDTLLATASTISSSRSSKAQHLKATHASVFNPFAGHTGWVVASQLSPADAAELQTISGLWNTDRDLVIPYPLMRKLVGLDDDTVSQPTNLLLAASLASFSPTAQSKASGSRGAPTSTACSPPELVGNPFADFTEPVSSAASSSSAAAAATGAGAQQQQETRLQESAKDTGDDLSPFASQALGLLGPQHSAAPPLPATAAAHLRDAGDSQAATSASSSSQEASRGLIADLFAVHHRPCVAVPRRCPPVHNPFAGAHGWTGQSLRGADVDSIRSGSGSSDTSFKEWLGPATGGTSPWQPGRGGSIGGRSGSLGRGASFGGHRISFGGGGGGRARIQSAGSAPTPDARPRAATHDGAAALQCPGQPASLRRLSRSLGCASEADALLRIATHAAQEVDRAEVGFADEAAPPSGDPVGTSDPAAQQRGRGGADAAAVLHAQSAAQSTCSSQQQLHASSGPTSGDAVAEEKERAMREWQASAAAADIVAGFSGKGGGKAGMQKPHRPAEQELCIPQDIVEQGLGRHPQLLHFTSPGLESRFVAWHARRLAPADRLANVAALLLLLIMAFAEPYCLAKGAPGPLALMAALLAAPLLLNIYAPKWYAAGREALLRGVVAAYVAFSAQVLWPLLAAHLPGDRRHRATWLYTLSGASLLANASLGALVRYRVYLPTQALNMALAAPALHQVCGAALGGVPPRICMPAGLCLLAGIGLVLPATVIHSWESRARSAFLRRLCVV